MIKIFQKNKHGRKNINKPIFKESVDERLKNLCDNFLHQNSIEIIDGRNKIKISPMKWLYPGYGEYLEHAIVPNQNEKIATEIVNNQEFVNQFLQDKRDIDGFFGYFVARVEGNYVLMSDSGDKIFYINESEIDDYDTIVLLKQARRLFPKFNTGTLSIDLKHIEIFGDVFNKLKSKLSVNISSLTSEQQSLMAIDIPTYGASSIKIENSIDSYFIFKLSETLEKLTQDLKSVSEKQARNVIDGALKRTEKVAEMLHGGGTPKRYLRTTENLEKITEKLNEISFLYKQTFPS